MLEVFLIFLAMSRVPVDEVVARRTRTLLDIIPWKAPLVSATLTQGNFPAAFRRLELQNLLRTLDRILSTLSQNNSGCGGICIVLKT